ncbi:MAG: DNA polymerase III subunit gamma/tau [Clostridiales bacterium]|nr:DNA polymerase III subunit gamma/tau [Clostridiales bacterium]
MSYQTLYRAFRPSSLKDVRGQEMITRVLTRQLETGRIAHAYLFCGSRGTGKTTTARAFARVVNCQSPVDGEPCGTCDACRQLATESNLDIVEIDAASNNGVDEIRELRERVKYPPVNGRYKVYIIDEVHMLSPAAFNALLKTLEEPPAHVVFILATTEPKKLPATVLSRCQRFDFRRVPMPVIVELMREILEKIDRTAETEALELIAAHSEGGLRDALSLLDMCLSYADEELSAETVRNVTGTAGRSFLFEYVDALISMDAKSAVVLIDRLIRDGRDLASFAAEVSEHLRALLLARIASDSLCELLEISVEDANRYRDQANHIQENRLAQITDLFLEAESRMKWLSSARAALELCTVRACRPEESSSLEGMLARIEALESVPRTVVQAAPAKTEKTAAPKETPAKVETPAAQAPGAPAPEAYDKAMEALVATMPMIRPQLSAMRYERREGNCIHTVFARKDAMQMNVLSRFSEKIAQALSEAFGEPLTVNMRREEDRPTTAVERPVRQTITAAQNLFGIENVEIDG